MCLYAHNYNMTWQLANFSVKHFNKFVAINLTFTNNSSVYFDFENRLQCYNINMFLLKQYQTSFTNCLHLGRHHAFTEKSNGLEHSLALCFSL